MKVHGSTELSRMLVLQRHSATTRAALDRAGEEMSTGLKADRFKASGGDLGRIYRLERMFARNAVHLDTIGLTGTRLEMMQLGLSQVRERTAAIAVDMLTATGLRDTVSAGMQAEASRQAFADIVGALNANVAGDSLFAGVATDRPPLRPADAILGEVAVLVADMTADEAIAALDAYFDGPDAFTGPLDAPAPTEMGDGIRLDYALQANDPATVAALKGHALAALVADGGAFAGADPADQFMILETAGRVLLGARDRLLALEAKTGQAQETVETAKAQRNAERESYDLARSGMLAADPYDSATMFEAMKAQLESIYTVTARLATLRFASFMR